MSKFISKHKGVLNDWSLLVILISYSNHCQSLRNLIKSIFPKFKDDKFVTTILTITTKTEIQQDIRRCRSEKL
ncbi:Glycerol-3-phosphate acyltransferase [Dirofilaria immitis]